LPVSKDFVIRKHKCITIYAIPNVVICHSLVLPFDVAVDKGFSVLGLDGNEPGCRDAVGYIVCSVLYIITLHGYEGDKPGYIPRVYQEDLNEI
jgi:hypothetical protein